MASVVGGIFMSKKEQVIHAVLEDFRCGRLRKKEAAELLGLSERSIQRKAKRLREQGLHGLKHGNVGRSPVNQKAKESRQEALRLIQEFYYDFNLVHAREMLLERHGIKISYGSLYNWCLASGLYKRTPRRRASKVRIARDRMANEGFFLQMDGSHHAWNGKDKWCLIAIIDDATSDIPYAEFFPTETTLGCMKVLRKIIEIKGVPEIIYTDEAGWAGSTKRMNFTQFRRACEELGIRLITTSSPQSKGRIERSFKTFQSRLVPELRLNNIKSMLGANQYLIQAFLPLYWQKRNLVVAKSETSRYRKLSAHINLDDIFCYKYTRIVGNDHCVQYENRRFRIMNKEYGSLRQAEITIHVYENGQLAFFFGHLKLSVQEMQLPGKKWQRLIS